MNEVAFVVFQSSAVVLFIGRKLIGPNREWQDYTLYFLTWFQLSYTCTYLGPFGELNEVAFVLFNGEDEIWNGA